MIWYVTVKDISAFFHREKYVFFGLLAGMVMTAFVLNYSYSFARYRGETYDHATGADVPVYRISGTGSVEFSDFEQAFTDFAKAGLPNVASVVCQVKRADGLRVAGATTLTPEGSWLTGTWTEGYALPISADEKNACAVNEKLLSYDGRLFMTGETFPLDGEDFVIRGVYETSGISGEADVVIFLDKYREKYGVFDDIWITFAEPLSTKEQQAFARIAGSHVEHGSIQYPEDSASDGELVTKSNQLQYSIFIFLLVVFLASILQYWYDVNLPTYTVYWLTGAKNRKILELVLCETLVLCGGSYAAGLVLNAVFRLVFTRSAPLTLGDLALGFGIFFGTMAVLGLINMVRICRAFSITNLRRE